MQGAFEGLETACVVEPHRLRIQTTLATHDPRYACSHPADCGLLPCIFLILFHYIFSL